jgi:transposase
MECDAGNRCQPLDHWACHQTPGVDTQKKTLGAIERDEHQRHVYRERVARRDADTFVVVDACGSNINLTPCYARAPRGARAYGQVPRNTAANTTLIASMSTAGMGPALLLTGATDTSAFEVYVEHVLAPTLRPGQVVVLDNLSAHKSVRVQDLIAARDCELWYLPAYSPDLSPIEEAFSKLKALLRRAEARTREALEQAIGLLLDQMTAQDARGYFTHCGYGTKLDEAQ